MTRSTNNVASRARRNKVLKLAKGFRGRSKNCYRIAIERVERALQYAYRDRKVKKRDFRSLWIQRINAGIDVEKTEPPCTVSRNANLYSHYEEQCESSSKTKNGVAI